MRSILHISDLHLAEGDDDQNLILKAFFRDVERMRAEGWRPQIVAFTGDIVRAGDSVEDYLSVAECLGRLLELLKLPDSRLVICPGNHDARRSIVEAEAFKRKGFIEASTSNIDDLFRNEEFQAYASDLFKNYSEFSDLLKQTARAVRTPTCDVHLFQDEALGVVSINTAILTGAGINHANDRDTLVFGAHQLRKALDAIPSGYAKLVLGHHPLDWLSEKSRAEIEGVLQAEAVAYLHGHMHDAQPRFVRGLRGPCFHAQSGALFMGRKYNGYSLITLDDDPAKTRVEFRSYFDKRNEFGTGEDQIASGIYYASEAAIQPSKDGSGMSKSEWSEHILIPFLKEECDLSLSTKPLSEVFVEPEFERDVPAPSGGPVRHGSNREILTFEALKELPGNVIISAPQESGRTSLLKSWAVQQAHLKDDNSLIPIYFQFHESPPYRARYAPFMRSKLPELFGSSKVIDIAEAGGFLFLIDDVDFQLSPQIEFLRSFISAFPKCKFIIVTANALLASAVVRPVIGETVEFENVRMRTLRANQVRKLVQRHGVTRDEDVDKLVLRMCQEMNNLSVPVTAVNSTFLLQIYSADDQASILNRAMLVERFIEILLDRYGSQNLVSGSFDFKNKTHLLSYIAERMVYSGNYSPEMGVLVGWVTEYVKEYGFPYDPVKLIEYFLSSRILKETDNTIAFKLKVFFEYFCGNQMANNLDFRDYILSQDRYLSFVNEIPMYCAITRNDETALELIRSRFEKTFSLREGGPQDGGVKIAALRDLRIPEQDATQRDLLKIEEQIYDRQLTDEERDKLLDEDEALDLERSQLVKKEQTQSSAGRSISLLLLLSAVIRNMDLVSDKQKRAIVTELLDGWNEFTLFSLSLIPMITAKGSFRFEGVDYRINFPEHLPIDEIARRLMFAMPVAVSRVAYATMGTEKLVNQLSSGIGLESEPIERQLMRFCIVADLGLPGVAAAGEKVAACLKGHPYLTNVLITKLHETLMRFKLPAAEADRLRALTAALIGKLAEGAGRGGIKDRATAKQHKGRLINTLKQNELALRVRLGKED
jgi:predicted MPP superfamily phosphohydrolase